MTKRPALRPLLGALAGLLLLAAQPGPAEAHGGVSALRVVAGPYRLVATVTRVGELLDETVTVVDTASGGLVRDALVTLSLRRGAEETRGPFLARRLGDSYEIRYPDPGDSGWRIVIEVAGAAGTATAEHRYRAPGRDWAIGVGSGPAGLAVVVLVGLAPIAALVLLVRLGGAAEAEAEPPREGGVAAEGGRS